MSVQRKHGQWGEDLATDYLAQKGLDIITRNWHYKKAEIDLICREKEILIFVEVKVKAYTHFGRPESSISPRKQRLLIDAAMAYMRSISHEWEIRFDIIAIIGTPDRLIEIIHFPDAFFPGLDYKG